MNIATIYSGGNSIEEVREQSFANFRKFVLILHIFLITCPKRSIARSTFSDLQGSVDTICKKSFLSFPYFSVVIKKNAKSKVICWKFAKLCSPPPPLPLQLNFSHCIWVAIFIILESQSEKLWHQNYKLRPQSYKLRVQNLQV